MKRALVSLAVIGALLVVPAFAETEIEERTGFYTVGVHLVPRDNGALPFLRAGYEFQMYENLFLQSHIGASSLLTPFDSWWELNLGVKYLLTNNLGIITGVGNWLRLEGWGVRPNYVWTWDFGAHYSFGGRDEGLGTFIKFHIPGLALVPDTAPVLNAWVSGGLEFRW